MFDVSNLETLISMAVRGLGVALAPQNNVEGAGLALRLVKLAGPPLLWRMMVVYTANADGTPSRPVSKAFLSLLNPTPLT